MNSFSRWIMSLPAAVSAAAESVELDRRRIPRMRKLFLLPQLLLRKATVIAMGLVSLLTLTSLDAAEPIHVWHFNEGVGDLLLDAAADPIDLKLYGGAERVEGRFGSAVQTGGGAYVQGPGLGAMEAGAIELWVKLLEPCGSGQVGIIGFGNPYGKQSDMALLGVYPGAQKGDPSRFGWGIYAGGWKGIGTEPPRLGQWRHLVANWGPSGMELFVDGQLAAREDLYLGLPPHAAVFMDASSWGRTAAMLIDQVRIYPRALPAEVVARHFADASYVTDPPQPLRRVVRRGAVPAASRNAADFDVEDSFTSGIQEAVDSLPRSGGKVYVPPGDYLLRRSIRLRDNVTLRGAGAATVLRRPQQIVTAVITAADAGAMVVQVQSAASFQRGQEVSVYDDRARGWHSTTAPIVAIDGKTLRLGQGLNHPVDPAHGAAVNNAFPMITAQHASNVVIADLTIDGGAGKPNQGVKDFTWAAIHLVDCSDSRIEGCWIRNHIADGISVQRGRGVTVNGNLVENCRGHGMHPGTGLVDSVWSNNIARENASDGLFFCMYVRHSVVSNNVLADNAGHGIGHVGGGGDKYNVVSSNTCVRNGASGIHVYDGSDNVITGNVCLNNSQAQPGRWPGIAVIKTTDTVISNNRCLDDQPTKTQAAGIVECEESDFNLFLGNLCRGHTGPGLTVRGANSQQQANIP